MRLICDLRAKRLDVLLELFPWVENALREAAEPPDPDIQAEITALKNLILSNGQTGNPRPLTVTQVRTPNLDDSSDDDIVLKKDTSTDSAKNFLDSMLALQE